MNKIKNMNINTATTSTTIKPITTDNLHATAQCSLCLTKFGRSEFTKTQWKKPPKKKKCKACTAKLSTGSNERKGSTIVPTTKVTKITNINMNQRPQRNVPGFEGNLTCCTDWPQTKRGEPPNAQSAVFNPLLACCFGPIEGYSTQEQIDTAFSWWSAALPSWPRWVKTLKEAGVVNRKDKLLQRAKGRPNPLIHKAKGHGTVPHIKGRDQSAALELDAMVSIEVYACVTCMYSTAALDAMEEEEQKEMLQESKPKLCEREKK